MAEGVPRFRHAGWQIDSGSGNHIDAELDETGRCWTALGPGIAEIHCWLKAVAGFDIRVRIERLEDGLALILDRGDLQPPWWIESAAPRLIFKIDGAARVATVTAVAGGGESVEKLLLYQCKIEG